jgi:low affinity Fe/Cu permease
MRWKDRVSKIATAASVWAGSVGAIVAMTASMVLYLVGGVCFHFSDGYQLLWNTFMSAVSYMLLFLIQNTQNRETMALHIKLDELIRAKRQADNALIGIEDMTEDQLAELSARYKRIAQDAGESS